MPHLASPFVTASDAHPIRSRPPPREIGRFAETSSVRWLRRVFAVLNRTAPSASARLAYALLTRPPRVPERAWEAAIRAQAHTSALPFGTGRLAVYEWGTGPAVLLVHGWGARATHFGKLVPALVASGRRVVAFDAPAHGRSSGRHTTLPDFAAAVAAVAGHAGEIQSLIAHSFGVAMALWAQAEWGLRVQRQVLFSSLDHCQWVTEEFARLVDLPSAVIERGRQLMVERTNGRMTWDALSVADWLRQSTAPTLLLHDADDAEVPIHHFFNLMKACAQRPLDLHVTEGLGHHRLLGDAGVIARVMDFLHAPGH